jgi:hypothetical protein
MPNVVRKLILVIKLTDASFVLVPNESHEPKHDYKNEATGLFAKFLLGAPKQTLESRAIDMMADIIGFRRPSDMESLKTFKDTGTEWHPVVLLLDVYGFDSNFIENMGVDRKDVMVIPLESHQYAQKLHQSLGSR